MRALILLLLGCLLAPGLASAGKVYRWVDAQGRVHYGDQPARDARELQQLDAPRPAASGAATAQGQSEPTGEASEEEAAARAAACTAKREQLKSYETATTLIEKDTLGREREYSSEERAQLVERARSEVQGLCEPAEG